MNTYIHRHKQVYRAGSAGKNLNKQGRGSRTYYDPLTGKRI